MSDAPKPGVHNERGMLLILGICACAMLAGLLMYLVGEALSLLGSGAPTGTSAFYGGSLLLRVLATPDNPAAAWPPGHRPEFGPVAFWILTGLAIAAAGALAFLLYRVIGRGRTSQFKAVTARWATRRDLAPLIVDTPTKNRLTLGVVGRDLVAAEPYHSVVVIGPPGSGKTTSFVEPAILEWQGPVIATSIKTDLMDNTIGARSRVGEVFVYDPAQVVDLYARHSWTPLSRCTTYDQAQATAKALVSAAKQSMGGSGDNDFWYQSAENLLAPYLFAAALGDLGIAKVVEWIDTQEENEPTAILLEHEEQREYKDKRALNALLAVTRSEAAQKSSIYTTGRTILVAYRDSKVLSTAERSDITPERLLGGGSDTVYLCAPMHEQKRLRPLYSTLITELINSVYERYTATGRPIDPGLLIVLDEAANITPLEELGEIASTARGVGMQLVTVFQDLAQARTRWGPETASTIVANHRARMFLSGIGDEHTLDYVARVTGDQEFRQASHTDSRSGGSVTESTTFRSIAPANVVRELPPNNAIAIYGHLPPARMKLRPWFDDPDLKRRAELEPTSRSQESPGGIVIDPHTGEIHEPDAEGALT